MRARVVWAVMREQPIPEPPPIVEPPQQDTTVVEVRPETPPLPPRTVLGDTMAITVQSVGPRLEGIRVTLDDDVRRPYWVDPDSSITFQVADQIVLEKQFERYRVRIGETDYPTDRLDAEERLVITRETAQAYLDSLTGH